MQRLKIALPDELRAQLDAASAKSGRSVAFEIRGRVEASFAQKAVDKPTRELVDRIALMPAEIEKEWGDRWYEDADAWKIFREAILDELGQKRPPETIKKSRARPHQTTESTDLGYLGRWIAMQLRLDPTYTNSQRRQMLEEMFRKEQEKKRKKQ
jgi:hypothetical protein